MLAAMTVGTAPARAGFGALAYDDSSGKYGLSSNEETQSKADDVAVKECGSDGCKIVFRTRAKECGAIAKAESGTAWGGGKGSKAAAELAAVQNCQKRTKGQCKIRGSECNK
ncbi:MAG TPA: DUF4189 domain-containing protein [Stellaceae bacterium]|nr:DUF4189 domain-containing protein [Stellaceae bacterium]